jgi:EAL domain-containing protein (putative c-di-GMP-specific phosphodiesterase class I)
VPATELVQKAEPAMSLAATSSKAPVLASSNRISDQHQERIQLEIDLSLALDQKQLQLHYQPKVCSLTGEARGLEALVHWEHPLPGMLSPIHFIPKAERPVLIDEIGEWVLNEPIHRPPAGTTKDRLISRWLSNLSPPVQAV